MSRTVAAYTLEMALPSVLAANVGLEAIVSLGMPLPTAPTESILVVSIPGPLRLPQGLAGFHLVMLKTAAGQSNVSGVSSEEMRSPAYAAGQSSHRSREMKFLSEHSEIFAKLVDEWVALEGEAIVAHGRDLAKVVAKARQKGVGTPFVFRVQSKLAPNEGTFGL